MSAEVIARVDAMWAEVGLPGERHGQVRPDNGVEDNGAIARLVGAARELLQRARP